MELKMLDSKELKIDGVDLRTSANSRSFAELKESIKAKGVLFPLVAAKSGRGYAILDGRQRFKAYRSLGADANKKLPVLIIKADKGTATESALVANAVRENLDSVGLAEAVNLLVNTYSRSIKDVAAVLGKSEVYVRRLLKIFTLPAPMLKALRQNELTLAHTHWLSRVANNPAILNESFAKAIKDNLSSRELETLISSLKQDKNGPGVNYFRPNVVTTRAGSRLRFEPRRHSVRVELNLNPDEPIDLVLAELKRHLDKLRPKRLKAVG